MTDNRSIMKNTAQVNAFLEKLDHPFKPEVQAVRDIIKRVNPNITEQIKWNAPTFSFKDEYLVTFNLHAKNRVHLVFHNRQIASVNSYILEGNYPDRRMAYFSDMNDVIAKSQALESVVKELLALIDIR
jgi:hypothetical protein